MANMENGKSEEKEKVVHEHYHNGRNSKNVLFVVLILVVLFIMALFFYQSGTLRNQGMQINVPDRIDVNLNQQN